MIKNWINKLHQGDALQLTKQLPDQSINCVVTSPPYHGLRDYGEENQIGMEQTPEEYVQKLVDLFREIWRVLKDDGTVWLNLGDSYANVKSRYSSRSHTITNKDRGDNHNKKPDLYHHAQRLGIKDKDLIGIPWRVAFALQQDGWYLRQDIIWNKLNPMPESVTDRCTKSHEYIFLLSKSQKYYYDHEAIKEEATGYDGRKDTKMKGSTKYKRSVVPSKKEHTMASHGYERWKFKNLKDNGQSNYTMHENRANGNQDEVYPVRNKRSVWTVNIHPYKEAHFAVFPEQLIKPCILAGCPKRGIVLDPFIGSGTTARVANRLNRNYIGFDIKSEYIEMSRRRINYVGNVKYKEVQEEDSSGQQKLNL